MKIGEYTTRIQNDMMRERKYLAAAFDRLPDATMFWGMIDLAGSTNFRILYGPREGYVRGETFFALIHSIITPCAEVRLLKEIGDAVFLAAPSFRPLFECFILIDQVTSQMASVAGTEKYPFSIRGGISYGAAKRMRRTRTDFLGSAIDILSRIMTIRSERTNLILHEDAYSSSTDIIKEYSDFLTLSESKNLSSTISKTMVHSVPYREICINRAALMEFAGCFAPWRNVGFR
ncbi:MAG: hypothetical protein ACE5GF_02375 [Thermodesulfobacteriota bacterium]